MKKSNDDNFWRKYLKVYDSLNNLRPYQKLQNDIISELSPLASDMILDAGAGTGNLAILIENSGASVTAIDNSRIALEILEKKTRNTRVILQNLKNKLPFEDKYFSKIVCNNTLYILPEEDYPIIINEFSRVLKNDGILILSNPLVGAHVGKIAKEHVIISIKENGVIKTIIECLGLFEKSLILFFYNFKILNNASKGLYHFFQPGEQEEVVSKHFKVIKTRMVYSGQNEMIVARKVI